MVVLAFLSDPPVVKRILRHLGLPDEALPLAPAVHVHRDEPLFAECAAGDATSRSPP